MTSSRDIPYRDGHLLGDFRVILGEGGKERDRKGKDLGGGLGGGWGIIMICDLTFSMHPFFLLSF